MDNSLTILATLITSVATFLTALAVLWQANLLKNQIRIQSEQSKILAKQNLLHAFIALESEWNSKEMIKARSDYASEPNNTEKLERVLEFLEKLAYFKTLEVFESDFIWGSTLGWYAFRYYFYNIDIIPGLRKKWKDELYTDIADLYRDYLEIERRKKSEDKIKQDLNDTKNIFFESEKNLWQNPQKS